VHSYKNINPVENTEKQLHVTLDKQQKIWKVKINPGNKIHHVQYVSPWMEVPPQIVRGAASTERTYYFIYVYLMANIYYTVHLLHVLYFLYVLLCYTYKRLYNFNPTVKEEGLPLLNSRILIFTLFRRA
jgi:hypothetical protein